MASGQSEGLALIVTYDEAQTVVDQALLGGPIEPLCLSTDVTDELHREARIACDNRQWGLARAYFTRLFDQTPTAALARDLAAVEMEAGDHHGAIDWYRVALFLNPDDANAHEHLIFLLDAQVESADALANAERQRYFRRFGQSAYLARQPHTNAPDPHKRIRVGYVSGYWNHHSAATAFASVLSAHSDQIEPVFYSTLDPRRYDILTYQVWKARFPKAFIDVHQMTPEWLAKVIREDEIDILVDLAGYTDGNRLLTFAHKPAPIQVQAWGYVLGTASPAIDVIFADRVVASAAIRRQLSERVYDLPSILGFMPRNDLPEEMSPLPCLSKPPVFAVFQRAMKTNPETWRVWRRILEAVPGSTIIFKAPDYTAGMRDRIVEAFGDLRNRISFIYSTGHREHLLCYQDIDLSLDPWPQTGGVSTLESLWMGVPTVTLIGDRMIQRASASIMANVGFGYACIADSEDDYIRRAVELTTTRRDELAAMRMIARDQMQASPIMHGYVEAVEAAYRTLWQEWCAAQQKTKDAEAVHLWGA